MDSIELIKTYQEHWSRNPPINPPKPLSEEQIRFVQSLYEKHYPDYVAKCREMQQRLLIKEVL